MESLFLNLIQILRQQDQTLAALLAASGEHNRALRDNDHAGIMASAEKQEQLSRTLRAQDLKREEVQGRLARRLGLKGRVAARELLPYASGPEAAEEIRRLAGSLKESMERLAEINKLNGVLARRGLQFTVQLRKFLLPGGGNTYHRGGELKKESIPLSIINKTV